MLRLKTMLRAALKPGQRTATRILAVLTSCALALSLQPQTANGQAATPTAAAAPTATAAVKAEGKTGGRKDDRKERLRGQELLAGNRCGDPQSIHA